MRMCKLSFDGLVVSNAIKKVLNETYDSRSDCRQCSTESKTTRSAGIFQGALENFQLARLTAEISLQVFAQ